MIRELKTLMAVAREGTFAAAGDAVGLTQAAVSAQMKRLEDELGFALFERTGRSARLNARGLQTLAQAQELLQLYGQLGARQRARGPAAFVHLGAIASVQQSLLPAAIARFHRQRPGSRTRVAPGVSSALLNLVDAGEIDAAVIIRPPFALQSDLRWSTLAREPFQLLVPRKYTGKHWRQLLAELPFIRYDRTSFGGRQVDRFLRAQRLSVQEVCEVDEPEALAQLVASGLGAALVPLTTGRRRWPAGVHALDLGAHAFEREIGLVHRADAAEPVQQLAQLLREVYGAD
ncbi:MAG: LysR family transcriptional regulator [Hydrogenophaga sp.]|uniref:LysR family transcriptional regulator n=1 Tax=Hydrogenophaga sp. TaxID=1904254 RepID=UPI001D32F3EA|nr:LysR family transcriptional regulator [Hydrogenophaga sp.]MBX3608865.1 LysR family transcriptional regulator [Hydrogenophaga sp.]